MKSAFFVRKLKEVFGEKGEARLAELLEGVGGSHPELARGIPKLLEAADSLVTQYSGLQHIKAELSGDAFSDWNLASGRIDSGRQWKNLLGYTDADVDDSISAWRRLLHADDLSALNAAIAGHVKSKSPFFQAECRLKARSGAWRWMFIKGKVVAQESDGTPLRLLLLQRDINGLRESAAEAFAAKEVAESASPARSYFLANMSHEIRTPMNGIIGMTELALDTQPDSEQKHYLRTIKASAESLLAIVNDILDFSKIESGKLNFEAVPFALSSLVFESVRSQSVAAHKKNLEVIATVASDVPSRVVGDPTRLRQVISNLVGNAVKFTEHGEVSVDVTVDECNSSFVVLRFAVRDSGVGIPKTRQAAIFEAFSQADDSTTRRFGGTGLGLAISSRLVEMMGGGVEVDSSEGEGACFTFTARFKLEASPVMSAASQVFSDRRVLLLEHKPRVSEQLKMCLAQAGVQVTSVADAVAALSVIEKSRGLGFPYDCILMDADMPSPAGMDLARSWQCGNCQEKLIMLLNTEQQRQFLQEFRDAGIDAHLVKPVAPEDVEEALALVFTSRAESESLFAPFDFLTTDPSDLSTPVEVLLVEDNPVNQELADRLLKKRGCRVTLANNGAEAVDCFEKSFFDIIFMDMQMPVMGGLEATESIRSREMRRS